MGKTYAYLRTSTDKQDLNNQKLEILEYARRHDLKVDEFIEIAISSRKTPKQRRIDELLAKLAAADSLMVSELSRLGRSTAEVIGLINELIHRQIRVIIIKQSLDIKRNHDLQSKVMVTLFSLFAELERDLISLRTKEALAAKKSQGVKLGKPKGTIQASKFDQHRAGHSRLTGQGSFRPQNCQTSRLHRSPRPQYLCQQAESTADRPDSVVASIRARVIHILKG